MIENDRQRMLDETIAAKRQAEETLRRLLDVKQGGEVGDATKDLFKRVTGSSSIENAISSTRRTLESYDRLIEEIRKTLTPVAQ